MNGFLTIAALTAASFVLSAKSDLPCRGAYDRENEQITYNCTPIAGADMQTFTPLSKALPVLLNNGQVQYAADRKHLYREGQPIFTFDGTARILWPQDDLDGWTDVFLFWDGQSIWLSRFDENSLASTVRMPITADDFTVIAPLRNAPSKPFNAVVTTDGTRVFYNDQLLEGVIPDGLEILETSDRQGAVGENALILSGYRNLAVRNTQTGEIHAVGKDGWRHVRITDDDGAPERAELFDGRIHVHLERYLHVWGDDETPDASTWEAIIPEGEKNQEGE